MDHALYAYSAQPARLAHEGETGLQGYVLLCLEHWHANPPKNAVRDPRFVGEFGSFTPDYRSWTQREYGLRIGLFRVLDALREAGLKPAIAANAAVLERLPELVQHLEGWSCEWVAHGLAANELMHGGQSLDEQRQHITHTLQTWDRCTGLRPRGWLSQDWGTTPHTYALLAEAGLDYTLDWCNDDQPYLMHSQGPTGQGLLAVPLSAEWDDVQCQWLRQLSPRAHAELTLAAFTRLHAECLRHRRSAVFGLALHPWLSGMSSRIGTLKRLLADLANREGVSWSSPGEIARRAQQHLLLSKTPHA